MGRKMVRYQVFLEPRQIKVMEDMAAEQGKSAAQVIREIVDRGLAMEAEDQNRRQQIWAEEEQFIETWMSSSGGDEKRTWNREDAY